MEKEIVDTYKVTHLCYQCGCEVKARNIQPDKDDLEKCFLHGEKIISRITENVEYYKA